MSLSATLFGTDSAIYKATNIMGLGVPGLLNKWFGTKDPEPTTQRIGELANQTAKEGGARPIVWGRVRPISGNIMHVSVPRIVKVEVEAEDSGGKGGGKKKAAKQYQERVYRTYAIRICEGPITAVIRIWRNNKLVYDARGNPWGAKNNRVFLRTFRFHLGGWAQMPDPALEGIWGAGNVPGYRGTCYLVAVDEDLTDMGGSVPQFVFEVERAEGTYNTSKPYAVESVEEFEGSALSGGGELRATLRETSQLEMLDSGGGFLEAGVFRNPLVELPVETEAFDSGGGFLDAGIFRSTLKALDVGNEAFDSGGGFLQAGVFRVGLISYNPDEFEAFDSGGASLIGGTHAIP